jgi:hypothetical protein
MPFSFKINWIKDQVEDKKVLERLQYCLGEGVNESESTIASSNSVNELRESFN